MQNGTHVPKRLLKLCVSFMGDHEDEISEYLRRQDAKGEYRELPSPMAIPMFGYQVYYVIF